MSISTAVLAPTRHIWERYTAIYNETTTKERVYVGTSTSGSSTSGQSDVYNSSRWNYSYGGYSPYGAVSYVGEWYIYAQNSYTYDQDTGVFTLTDPQKISVTSLKSKQYRWFMAEGTSGNKIYDNNSHSLPADVAAKYDVSYISYEKEAPTTGRTLGVYKKTTTSSGRTVYKPVKDSSGKKVEVEILDDTAYVKNGVYESTGTEAKNMTVGIVNKDVGPGDVQGENLVWKEKNYTYTNTVTTVIPGVTYNYAVSDGYIVVSSSSNSRSTATFSAITGSVAKTGSATYVTNSDRNKYPDNGAKSGHWYVYKASDNIDPLGITVLDVDGNQIFVAGDPVRLQGIESTAQTLNNYGASIKYNFWYSIDGAKNWTKIIQTTSLLVDANTPDQGVDYIYVAGISIEDGLGYVGEIVTSSNISVLENRPPFISDVDRDLGEITDYDDKPVIYYTVWDEDVIEVTDEETGEVTEEPMDIVTVEEYIDDFPTYTYSFKGEIESIFRFEDYYWLSCLNGQHEMRIVATDSAGNVTVRKFTFTKNVSRITAQFAEPFENIEPIYLACENMIAELPTGAELLVEVCNNGFDEHPNWQNVTTQVRNGTNIYIRNGVCTAGKWGYNIRFTIDRGEAESLVYLKSCTGTFKGRDSDAKVLYTGGDI